MQGMILYCVRHGESVYNAEGRIQGRLNVPLSELGRRQSAAAAAALARRSADALCASPLRRAMETAEIIADALGLPIQIEPRLMEIDCGVFQDKRPGELAELYPQAWAQWKSEDLDFVIPGGESRRQVIARGRAAFLAIAAAARHAVIVVAHGRLLTCTLKDVLGIPASQLPFSLQNGSITTLSADGSGRFELLRWIRSIICAGWTFPAWAICKPLASNGKIGRFKAELSFT